MPSKLCPKIILEGTRLTYNTESSFALNEHPRIVLDFVQADISSPEGEQEQKRKGWVKEGVKE